MEKKSRKIRSDSKLGRLPRDVQQRIADWCAQDSLASAAQRCAAELSVQVSSQTISEWYQRWRLDQATAERKQALTELFQHADANAQAVGELLRDSGATEEQIARADRLVFTLQASSSKNADLWMDLEKLRIARETAEHRARMDLAKLEQKERDLELAGRRVTVLEARLEAIKSTVEDSTLSDEERAQRIAEIYGRA